MANGKMLSVSEAREEIQKYRELHPKAEALGHVYDWSIVEDILQIVKQHNEENPKNPVVSMRLYLAWDDESPHEDKTDIVWMPVTADGKDLYPVFDELGLKTTRSDGDSTAAHGNPCPKFCNTNP